MHWPLQVLLFSLAFSVITLHSISSPGVDSSLTIAIYNCQGGEDVHMLLYFNYVNAAG